MTRSEICQYEGCSEKPIKGSGDYCSRSHLVKSKYNDRYCPECDEVTAHQRESCTRCAKRRSFSTRRCSVCDKDTTHSGNSCVSCAEKKKYTRRFCDDCYKETSHRSSGECLACAANARVTFRWCDDCQSESGRTSGGRCMRCVNSNHSLLFCYGCDDDTVHKGETCLTCANQDKFEPALCGRCEVVTMHSVKNGKCRSCNSSRMYTTDYCDTCEAFTTFSGETCLRCSRKSGFYDDRCEQCQRTTKHFNDTQECSNCVARHSAESRMKDCSQCERTTVHTSVGCMVCLRRAYTSRRHCLACQRSTTHAWGACLQCSTAKGAKKKFKEGRNNRSKIEMKIVSAIGFEQSIIERVTVDGIKGNVVFEYDGEFFHQRRITEDTRTTQKLLDAGYNVIRLREGKLEHLPINHPQLLQFSMPYKLSNTSQGLAEIVRIIEEFTHEQQGI